MTLPPPDTHCWDEDTSKDVWSYSADQMRAYAEQAVAAEQVHEPGVEYKRGYEEALNDCLRNGLTWARSMFADGAEHIKPAVAAEQVPVAWQLLGTDSFLTAAAKTHHGARAAAYDVPLYTHPPQQRRPLTHQQLLTWWNATTGSMQERVIQYGQFVERSHGITGEPT